MLAKQQFFLSLAQGISTKEDPKQVIAGKLLTLENGIFISPKEIKKRNGYDALSLMTQNNFSFTELNIIPSAINSGNFLSSFDKEIVLNDDFNLYSYSESLDQWIYKDRNSICELSTTSIIRNINSQTLADSAISTNGIQLFAWEDSLGSVRLSIVDTQTNQTIINSQKVPPIGGGTTVKPKCAFLGGRLILFYLDTSTNMHLYYITYTNGVFTAPTLLVTDVNVSSNKYDIVNAYNRIYITYNTNAASIKTFFLTTTLATSSVHTTSGQNADNCITIFPGLSGNIWVAFAYSTGASYTILSADLSIISLVVTPFSNDAGIYNITGVGIEVSLSTVFIDFPGSPDSTGYYSNSYVQAIFLDDLGDSGGSDFIRSTALQSKAFITSFNGFNIPNVVLAHDSYLQATYFLCNLYNFNVFNSPINQNQVRGNVVAKIAPNSGGGIPKKSSSLSSINQLSTGIFQTALLKKDLLFTTTSSAGTVNTYTQTGVISASFDFTVTNLNNNTLGQNLHIGSGMLSMYDGSSVVEHNFNIYPENIAITVNTSGGNLTDNSSYGYQVTYEWIDNQGQLHRSSPSPVQSITTGSHSNASQAVLTIPTLRITAKTFVNIVIYRTQANGTVYYRLNSPTNPLLNDPTIDSVMYTDNAADSSIGANEQIYTTGGEVVNSAAPASSIIGEYKNRLILIPSEDPYSWWYSKQVIPGSPVEFSDVFVQNIGTENGPITAVIQMDSNLILFKENNIYYVVGDGPSPSGANNDFTQALSISSDVGCINSQSMILMPMGIIFKSNKGIYLLGRSLAVQYIGADVEAFNSSTVTSSQLIVETNQIRFTLNSGITLMYDYFVSQWSVFTNINALSSIITSNNFTYLQSNGLVLQETPGAFTDNGNFIKLKITTSWLSLSGIQGFQRIYKAILLGQYFGPHKLLVQAAYDFNPINTQQTYFDATKDFNANIYGQDPFFGTNSPYGGQYPTYQYRLFTDKQVCEAVQFTIEDVPFAGPYVNNQGNIIQAGYNESFSLSAISLELGIKKGLNKVASNRSLG